MLDPARFKHGDLLSTERLRHPYLSEAGEDQMSGKSAIEQAALQGEMTKLREQSGLQEIRSLATAVIDLRDRLAAVERELREVKSRAEKNTRSFWPVWFFAWSWPLRRD